MTISRQSASKSEPNHREEAKLMAQGYALVGGLDEVGRGSLAGPVVAGLVILPTKPKGSWIRQIRDSKQMTPAQRDSVLPHLEETALAIGVGISSHQEVDHLGIVPATQLAMKRTLDSLALLPQFLLLDALTLPDVAIPQKAIIHGDTLCVSIAAASIVAKVARDRIMREEDTVYPGYGFAKHKGYGTSEHVRNLKRLGPCPIHRYSFAPVKHWANEE